MVNQASQPSDSDLPLPSEDSRPDSCIPQIVTEVTKNESVPELIFLLPCPRCGDQKQASASSVGRMDQCRCGYQYRITLTLEPILSHTPGFLSAARRHSIFLWRNAREWWCERVVPSAKNGVEWCKRIGIPRTIDAINASFVWTLAKSKSVWASIIVHLKEDSNPIEARSLESGLKPPVANGFASEVINTPDDVNSRSPEQTGFQDLTPHPAESPSRKDQAHSVMWKKLFAEIVDSFKGWIETPEPVEPPQVKTSLENPTPAKGYGFHSLHQNRPPRPKVFEGRLLSTASSNTITRRGSAHNEEYRCCRLKLSPADMAGGATNCMNANKACILACSGLILGSMYPSFFESQVKKTRSFQSNRLGFAGQLMDEIEMEVKYANRERRTLLLQLNESSDIPWESKAYGEIPQQFPEVLFMDFTKLYSRIEKAPENYKLVASWTREQDDQAMCISLLEKGYDVSVVFAALDGSFFGNKSLFQRLPKQWQLAENTYAVFDGDDTDLSFLSTLNRKTGKGRICGKRLRSDSKAATLAAIANGFCVGIEPQSRT